MAEGEVQMSWNEKLEKVLLALPPKVRNKCLLPYFHEDLIKEDGGLGEIVVDQAALMSPLADQSEEEAVGDAIGCLMCNLHDSPADDAIDALVDIMEKIWQSRPAEISSLDNPI
jgi:hypothetical protein